MIRRLTRCLPALAVAALLASSVQGMFMRPTQAPIDRLITNTEAYIKENPKDATGYYTLARIHYLAASHKVDTVGVAGMGQGQDKGLPALAADNMQGGKGGGVDAPSKDLTDDEVAAHAKAGAENYLKAIELDPKNGLYHLGYASLLDSAAATPEAAVALIPGILSKPPIPAVDPALYKALASTSFKERSDAADKLRAMLPAVAPRLVEQLAVEKDAEAKQLLTKLLGDVSRITALSEYAQAFDLTVTNDLKIQNRPISGLNSLVSYESATRYDLIAKDLPANADKDEIAKMAAAKKALDGKRMGPVTPIIFSLEPGKRLADLTAPETTTTFDLDGTQRGFAWQWVKGDAAILAWDPNHTGKITSGWQLFGNVTFNMIWTDGYRALDALDDNRDGVLSGDELKGMVIWYDRNHNGISDPGEVIAIEQTAIQSIKVHPDVPTSGDARRVPMAAKGLLLRDGATVPTWDWMTSPK